MTQSDLWAMRFKGPGILVAAWIFVAIAARVLLLPGSASAAEGPCPNEQFRTGLGASLPDCRAYEQVTPIQKNGAAVEGFPSAFTVTEDGSGITWFNTAATAVPASGGSTASYPELFTRRVGAEWQTQRLMPPQLPVGPGAGTSKANYLGITPDGHYAIAMAIQADCGGQICSSLWLIDTETEVATQIATSPAAEAPFAFDGASQDGSKVFFESKTALLPEAVEGFQNLYMWDRATGGISLVDVLPGEVSAPEEGAFGGPYEWTTEGFESGGALAGLSVQAVHAASMSGEQFFFTVPYHLAEFGNPPELRYEFDQIYIRQGLGAGSPSTLKISAPNEGVNSPNSPAHPAAFQEATPDGAHAFFLSGAKLTKNANTGPNEEGSDLYRWDRSTEELADITPDLGEEKGAQVRGLLGTNESGTAGFLVAEGVLASGGTAEALNIYRFVEIAQSTFSFTFIADLSKENAANFDGRNWIPRTLAVGAGEHAGANPVGGRTSRVDPSAETLLFTSVNQLTDFRNSSTDCRGPGNAETQEQACSAIYLYSMKDPRVKCISCNPRGINLGFEPSLEPETVGVGQFPNFAPANNFMRNLTQNGRRVFFETPEPLVSADVNGGVGCVSSNCSDVYQWEAPGEGTCQQGSGTYSLQNEGCIDLISPGQSRSVAGQGSSLLGASPDGRDVFIATNAPLVATDIDEAGDIYDVPSDGGSAAQHPAAVSKCASEECQGAAALPPEAAVPATTGVFGTGNATPSKKKKQCHKGRKKRRCQAGKSHHDKARTAKDKKAKKQTRNDHRPGRAADAKRGENGGVR